MLLTSRFSTLMPTFLFDTLKSKKKMPFGSLEKGKKNLQCEQINLRREKRLSANFFISLFPHILISFFNLTTMGIRIKN